MFGSFNIDKDTGGDGVGGDHGREEVTDTTLLHTQTHINIVCTATAFPSIHRI
jgi:hypothetical protein